MSTDARGKRKTRANGNGEHTLLIFRVSVLHGKFAAYNPPDKCPPAVMKAKWTSRNSTQYTRENEREMKSVNSG